MINLRTVERYHCVAGLKRADLEARDVRFLQQRYARNLGRDIQVTTPLMIRIAFYSLTKLITMTTTFELPLWRLITLPVGMRATSVLQFLLRYEIHDFG